MTYDSVVLGDSPTLFLKTEETTGTTFTDSGSGGHNATLTGPGATLAVDILGEKGVEFTGDGTYLSAAVGSLSVAGSWECIIKVYSDTTAGNIGYASVQNPSDTGNRNLGRLFGNASYNADGVGPGGLPALGVGEYHLVATQAAGGAQVVYVGGVSVGTGSYTPTAPTGGSLFAPMDVFDAGIVHVAIGKIAYWDGVVLTSTQVAAHYAALGTVDPPVTPAGASVLTLRSFEEVTVTPPPTAPGLTVQPLHIVSPAVPVPTLVNGRPQ